MTIRFVHEEAISPDLLYQRREPEWFFGRKVKIAFESHEGKVEWMWVQVLEIDGNTLSGKLVCSPIFCTHLAYGDPITLSRLQLDGPAVRLQRRRQQSCGSKSSG